MTVTVKYKNVVNRWSSTLVYDKDQDDVSDIVFNYSGELGSDTISTATATTTDITAGSPTISANTVTFSISGGDPGGIGRLELKIVTTGGDTLSNNVKFRVNDYYEGL